MPEQAGQITIISDLLKRDPAYKEVVEQLEGRLYDRYMVYLSDKPKFNAKTQAIPKQYLSLILSFKNTLELNKIASKYKLSQEQRDKIPEILWKIFYREAEIKNLPQMLNSELNINSIRSAYMIAVDIANIYLPISDYLGDIPMVVKRWQYEMPSGEPTINQIIQPKITTEQPPQAKQEPVPTIQASPVAPPPIRQPEIVPTPKSEETIDESIPKVQETLARLSQKQSQEIPQVSIPMQSPQATPWQAQIQPETIPQTAPKITPPPPTGKSDFEPEYLPDESASKPANPSNVIDLKNF